MKVKPNKRLAAIDEMGYAIGAQITVKIPGAMCHRCGHQWLLRNPVKPRICPKCKSPYWDVQRKKKSTGASRKTA